MDDRAEATATRAGAAFAGVGGAFVAASALPALLDGAWVAWLVGTSVGAVAIGLGAAILWPLARGLATLGAYRGVWTAVLGYAAVVAQVLVLVLVGALDRSYDLPSVMLEAVGVAAGGLLLAAPTLAGIGMAAGSAVQPVVDLPQAPRGSGARFGLTLALPVALALATVFVLDPPRVSDAPTIALFGLGAVGLLGGVAPAAWGALRARGVLAGPAAVIASLGTSVAVGVWTSILSAGSSEAMGVGLAASVLLLPLFVLAAYAGMGAPGLWAPVPRRAFAPPALVHGGGWETVGATDGASTDRVGARA